LIKYGFKGRSVFPRHLNNAVLILNAERIHFFIHKVWASLKITVAVNLIKIQKLKPLIYFCDILMINKMCLSEDTLLNIKKPIGLVSF
jgi:hypothetical protein